MYLHDSTLCFDIFWCFWDWCWISYVTARFYDVFVSRQVLEKAGESMHLLFLAHEVSPIDHSFVFKKMERWLTIRSSRHKPHPHIVICWHYDYFILSILLISDKHHSLCIRSTLSLAQIFENWHNVVFIKSDKVSGNFRSLLFLAHNFSKNCT